MTRSDLARLLRETANGVETGDCTEGSVGWNMEAVATKLRAARMADAERVRQAVRDAVAALLSERGLYIVKPYQPTMGEIALDAYGHGRVCDAEALQGKNRQALLEAIADRVAAECAAPTISQVVDETAERFNARPPYRASIEARAEIAARARASVAVVSIDIPADLVPSVAHALSRMADIYRNDKGNSPEGVAVLQHDADRLDEIADLLLGGVR